MHATTRLFEHDRPDRISKRTPVQPPRKVHSIWQYLLEHGEPGQIRRLQDDPGLEPDAPVLTVSLAEDETRGFSLGLEQLARHGAFWLPDHDIFVTLADAPVDFAEHLASLEGQRVLDRVRQAPESTLAQWTDKWEDVGNPNEWNRPWEVGWLGTRGHLVGTVARHGSLYKFGIDRWGSVRPDFASPHRFRFDPLWPDCRWTGQRRRMIPASMSAPVARGAEPPRAGSGQACVERKTHR